VVLLLSRACQIWASGFVVRQCNTFIIITMLVVAQTYCCCEASPAWCCSVQRSRDGWHGWLVAVGCIEMLGVDECSPTLIWSPHCPTRRCVYLDLDLGLCGCGSPRHTLHCTACQAGCAAEPGQVGPVMPFSCMYRSVTGLLLVKVQKLLCHNLLCTTVVHDPGVTYKNG